MILETNRLILREMNGDDLDGLYRMLLDPEVMTAYDHRFTREEAAQWLLRQQNRYHQDGFGLWAVTLRETGAMIGQAGITWQPFGGQRVLEVGYLLEKAFWHQGYAVESARACRDWAFQTLRPSKVHSIIRWDNLPSMKVTSRIGMRREVSFHTRYFAGEMLHWLYTITREEWEDSLSRKA